MRRWQAVTVLVVAIAAMAVPATAAMHATSGKTAATAKKKRRAPACRRTRVRGERVLLCRGPRGARGPRGFRGFRGATGATGATGSQGPAGTARAYAVVNPAPGGTPSFVGAQTLNFTAIRRAATGVYCLTAGAGITPAQTAAITAPEISFSASGVTPYPVVNARSTDCAPTEYEVRTFDGANVTAPTNGAAFSIAVP